jgi:GGDEF domain-containing protein
MHLEVGVGEISLAVSIGIGVYSDDAHDFDELMRVADRAMYAAKREHYQRQERALKRGIIHGKLAISRIYRLTFRSFNDPIE